MLAFTKKGTECSIDAIRDCDTNEGGAYCEVYIYDEDGDCCGDSCDFFCIHPEDCPSEGVFNEAGGLTNEAERFATKYINSITTY